MSAAHALDVRPANDAFGERPPPASREAEQALLGAVLYDNAAIELVQGWLRPEHLVEGFHQRLLGFAYQLADSGRAFEPVLAAERFKDDVAYNELGGVTYLADLVDRAPPAVNAPDYARIVADLAARRELIGAAGEMIAEAMGGDVSVSGADLLLAAERKITALASAGAVRDAFVGAGAVITHALDTAQARDGTIAFPSGLAEVDALLGGLTAGEVTILAGRPGMGKSTVGLTVARANAQRGLAVPFFSLEMSEEPLGLRLACDLAYDRARPFYSGEPGNPTYDRARKGLLSPEQWRALRDAAETADALPLRFDTRPGLTASQIEVHARRFYRDAERRGLKRGPLIVDHLGIVRPETARGGNKVAETSDISRSLAETAKRLGVPVVALCQISRNTEGRGEDKRPTLADLRWSGAIEEDARQVVFLYRPAYYLRPPEDPAMETPEERTERLTKLDRVRHKLFWIVAKNNSGALGQVETYCDIACSAVRDRSEFGY